MTAGTIEIRENDGGRDVAFEAERVMLAAALGSAAVALHHIGSTAVPGLAAKPIIDILVEAAVREAIDARTDAMETLGYEALGEYGIAGRRYFRKIVGGRRTHHVHAFIAGSFDIARHLAVRDRLRADSAEREAYAALKRRLAAEPVRRGMIITRARTHLCGRWRNERSSARRARW